MATIVASIAVAVAAGLVLVTLRNAILWLFIAFFLTMVLHPLVDGLARRVPRPLAVVMVLTLCVSAAAGVGILAVPPFVEQVRSLVESAPATAQKLSKGAAAQRLESHYHLISALDRTLRNVPAHLASAAQPLLAVVGSLFRLGVATISVFFLVLFMLLSGRRTIDAGLRLLDPHVRRRIERLGRSIYWATARYALGTGFLALLAGGVATVILAVAGVPYFLPLGVTMIFLDLIPFAGFVTGGVLITVVTGATVGWGRAIAVLAVFVIYQTLESHLVLPVVHRKTVRVSPLGIVVALIVGLELAGILGVLFAVPVAGALRIVFREILAHRAEQRREALAAREAVAVARPARTEPDAFESDRLPRH